MARYNLPEEVSVSTLKREYVVAIDSMRILVEKVCIGARHPFVIKHQLTCAQNLRTCKQQMDNLQIPCFAVKDLKDDSRGPGAGLMASNENLFSAQVSRSRHAPLTSSTSHCRRLRIKLNGGRIRSIFSATNYSDAG